jgi:hypothetical protein
VLLGLTGVAWLSYKHVDSLVTGEDYACWPLWPGCESVRPLLSPGLVRVTVYAMLACSVGAAVLFALRRIRPAVAAFIGGLALGAAIYALDYRLRLNQTYMLGWVVLVLLVAPRRAQALQAIVALFYFWAGALKLNREWLSGAALYAKPLLVPQALVPAACVYVVVLEMGLLWGLFASSPRARWARWAIYGQLLVFHAVSWSVVGWYYPLLMAGITAIYPLVWVFAPDQMLTWSHLRADRALRNTTASLVVVFSALQLMPRAFPGDTAITGEGRLFALHMFDARVECEGGANVSTASGQHAHVAVINERLEQRMRCDPIVLSQTAQRLCRQLEGRPDSPRVDVVVEARRASDPHMQPLIHVDDFCRRDVSYSLWHHNAWIGGP